MNCTGSNEKSKVKLKRKLKSKKNNNNDDIKSYEGNRTNHNSISNNNVFYTATN